MLMLSMHTEGAWASSALRDFIALETNLILSTVPLNTQV